MIYAKTIVTGLNRFYRGHFQNAPNIKTFFGYAFSDNVQYNVLKPRTIIDSISPDKRELIPSKTYAGRELLSVLEEMVAFTQFVNDGRVIKTHKLSGITEMDLNPISAGGVESTPSRFFPRHRHKNQPIDPKLSDL